MKHESAGQTPNSTPTGNDRSWAPDTRVERTGPSTPVVPTHIDRTGVDESGPDPGRRPTSLYRLLDRAGALLYVGIAGNPGRRFDEHSKDKGWWGRVDSVRLEHFETREAAVRAEASAIVVERPKYNVAGKSPRGHSRALWDYACHAERGLLRLAEEVTRVSVVASRRRPCCANHLWIGCSGEWMGAGTPRPLVVLGLAELPDHDPPDAWDLGQLACPSEMPCFGGFKRRLVRMVGWDAAAPELRREDIYEAVYERLYQLLPACDGCSCF